MALSVVDARIPDERIGNKADVANWFAVSLTTVDQWLRRGCPYLQRGERGKQWKFDLLAVAKWKYGAAEPDSDTDPEQLSPKDRLDWYRGTREKTKHMMEAGDLIPAAEYERALSTALKSVAMTLESLPDLLERDAAIPPEAVEKTIQIIDRLREQMHSALVDGVA
jgi:phage terminase Nu1 subunit (DNA packaging protein)